MGVEKIKIDIRSRCSAFVNAMIGWTVESTQTSSPISLGIRRNANRQGHTTIDWSRGILVYLLPVQHTALLPHDILWFAGIEDLSLSLSPPTPLSSGFLSWSISVRRDLLLSADVERST